MFFGIKMRYKFEIIKLYLKKSWWVLTLKPPPPGYGLSCCIWCVGELNVTVLIHPVSTDWHVRYFVHQTGGGGELTDPSPRTNYNYIIRYHIVRQLVLFAVPIELRLYNSNYQRN